jgi:putative heme-binding domain-containing protein
VRQVIADAGGRPEFRAQIERFARRAISDHRPGSAEAVKAFLRTATQTPSGGPAVDAALRGIDAALDAGKPLDSEDLRTAFRPLRQLNVGDADEWLRALARLGDRFAISEVYDRVRDYEKRPFADWVKWFNTAARMKDHEDWSQLFLNILTKTSSEAHQLALLGGLERLEYRHTTEQLLAQYPKFTPKVRQRALGVMLTRPAWTLDLFKDLDAGKFPKADLTLDHARTAVGLTDPAVTALVEKHFGKLAPATPGEKQARISWLTTVLNRDGLGDPANGKALFTKHCAACHQLFGEGGKVGPDLTTADRKNRGYFLAQVVDPSGYIRPEYVSYKVDTLDGRSLTGLIEPSAGESVTLVSVVDNQPQRTTVAKKDVDKMTPLPVSLMPEKLLDTLTEAEVRDLFAHLLADQPKAPVKQAKPAAKKLKVALVSGSLEYKSDESLPAFQKHLEENYPVECVRMFRKTDTDIPGLEGLETCDAAIFFTRRLKLDGKQLDLVKKYVESGKPIVGIRTASHGFQNWLEMDRLVFGGDYKNHYGAGPKCDVKVVEAAKDHPVLKGVNPYQSTGSLYKNPNIEKDVTVLLTGSIPGNTEPVAWVRERKAGGKPQRVFYTSLGHPDDFKDPNYTRLLANGLMWTLGQEFE